MEKVDSTHHSSKKTKMQWKTSFKTIWVQLSTTIHRIIFLWSTPRQKNKHIELLKKNVVIFPNTKKTSHEKKISLFWGWSIWRWIISLKVCLFLGGRGRGKRSSPSSFSRWGFAHLPGAASRLHPPWPIPTWTVEAAEPKQTVVPFQNGAVVFRSVFWIISRVGFLRCNKMWTSWVFLEKHWHHGTHAFLAFSWHTQYVQKDKY